MAACSHTLAIGVKRAIVFAVRRPTGVGAGDHGRLGYTAAANAPIFVLACARLIMSFPAIALVASDHPRAREALERLRKLYATVPPERADIIVALGGDGFMLETLHRYMNRNVPIFGMNRGSVGFLMNTFSEDDAHRAGYQGRADRP